MSRCDFVSHPISCIQGEITVPGDKSISHRALMLGAIAQGITRVTGFLDGDDCMATLQAFRSLGVRIEGPVDQRIVIHGVGKYGLKKAKHVLDCGNSGTSIRLLAGLLAAQSFDTELTGDQSLLKRPMARIKRPLDLMGAEIHLNDDRPPLRIKGGKQLHGIAYDMPEASAQVKSCILLAGLYAEGETTVIEPGVTRDHTELMLEAFGYPIQRSSGRSVIQGGFEGIGTDIQVPGDISSAAFFIVAATLIPNSHITIRSVGLNPTRTGVIQILQLMGADIQITHKRFYGKELVGDVVVRYAPLVGIQIPIEWVPLAIDEFPIVFIAASCARGQTILRGAKELRCKESDRIGAMADGLQHLGIDVTVLDDGMIIEGGTLQGGCVDSREDHRIAMAFAIAGSLATGPITIKGCEQVRTSFPTFVSTARHIQLAVEDVFDEQ